MVSDLDDDAASSGKTARLRQHVEDLAGAIGERNVFRPEALRAAAHSICWIWRAEDHRVESQPYATHGVDYANLEVSRPSVSRPADILLFGSHYGSVRGSPGANDNASGVAALLEIARALARTFAEFAAQGLRGLSLAVTSRERTSHRRAGRSPYRTGRLHGS